MYQWNILQNFWNHRQISVEIIMTCFPLMCSRYFRRRKYEICFRGGKNILIGKNISLLFFTPKFLHIHFVNGQNLATGRNAQLFIILWSHSFVLFTRITSIINAGQFGCQINTVVLCILLWILVEGYFEHWEIWS